MDVDVFDWPRFRSDPRAQRLRAEIAEDIAAVPDKSMAEALIERAAGIEPRKEAFT